MYITEDVYKESISALSHGTTKKLHFVPITLNASKIDFKCYEIARDDAGIDSSFAGFVLRRYVTTSIDLSSIFPSIHSTPAAGHDIEPSAQPPAQSTDVSTGADNTSAQKRRGSVGMSRGNM